MTTHQEGYQVRYQKIKTSKLRSTSPSHYEHHTEYSPSMVQLNQESVGSEMELGKVVALLAERIDGVEVKMVNITNIVKLLQKYSETKDIQYEKQKQQQEYLRNTGDKIISTDYLSFQTKIQQLQSIGQRAKAQITAMEGLRMNMQRQNSKKQLKLVEQVQATKTVNPLSANLVMPQLEEIVAKMQIQLRQQLNKKIDICMNFFKNAIEQYRPSAPPSSSQLAINSHSIEQQMNKIMLAVSKVQGDCHKNIMIIQNKIEQIVSFVSNSRRKENDRMVVGEGDDDGELEQKNCKSDQRVNKGYGQYTYSQHSPFSNKSIKSKSKSNSISKSQKISEDKKIVGGEKGSLVNKIDQQKKQKEIQLKEALKKKKENQEKLKMKK